MPANSISTQLCQSSLQQDNQTAISRVLQSENLLRSIDMIPNRRLCLQVCSWEQYWEPVTDAFTTDQIKMLDQLKTSRSLYIKSKFDLAYAKNYCYEYFVFLRTIIASLKQDQVFSTVLGMILCLESSVVHGRTSDEGFAAVTSNVRNPIYLLAKIRCPQVYDDPKFLPLLMACRSAEFSLDFMDVYYHYRQYSIDAKRKISLFVYPAVTQGRRSGSFLCIQKFTSLLTRRTDPRAKSRANCISDYAIEPFVKRGLASCGKDSFSVVDLGGGSGSLSQRIFERLAENNTDIFSRNKFDWTLVDLQPHNTRRFLRNKQLLRLVSGIRCERRDWRQWIQASQQTSCERRFDVILCCRLFDNLSQFSIAKVGDWYQINRLSRGVLSQADWLAQTYLPDVCLAPDGVGSTHLIASNSKIKLLSGSTFQLLSLSDYFRAVDAIWRQDWNGLADSKTIFFPVRRLNSDALLLNEGQDSPSALSVMCELSRLVVIEDVDLTPGVLHRHLKEMNLSGVAASDATSRKHMPGTNLLCLSGKENQKYLPGKRFW